jgi:hypothetical protein
MMYEKMGRKEGEKKKREISIYSISHIHTTNKMCMSTLITTLICPSYIYIGGEEGGGKEGEKKKREIRSK